ncbi:MAG: hypothetical protein HC886_16115 [Leptolyngbyaceae cyanobacterium SM1_1_3]|nr:hypothetical protein [Leptolyngbyaceae cyanobacterium SM1_1_3]NJN03746.1 hypothetical protein [Leptolyngbyaceae cyanobacterium RM1_1_2]NJO08535.1 hypothetical protein [Leptolyngbyaceae cyanobacterium SL_1_1]
MFALDTDYTIHYRITESKGSFKLSFWEPATRNEYRTQPYLFRANYLLPTIEAAQNVLKQYILVSGANGLPSTELPNHGKIRVFPHPTWSGQEFDIAEERSRSA